ncbi:MAG: hypothetical protein EA406_07445 [Rhodospirillales bacterium]|nr:MAG: hypothetical protein EA406_07445 [Rhodospirillales bacterium]
MTAVLNALTVLITVTVIALGDRGAGAQALPFETGATGDFPLEILADDGIEWLQSESVVHARGNARAIRGDLEVKADILSAHYREGSGGETEIWRLVATGNVVITTPQETAYADRGVYDLDSAILILSSRDPAQPGRVRVDAENGRITADEQMEFWQLQDMLVARGNARAEQEGRTLTADILVAYLTEAAEGGQRLSRVEAFDNVAISTPEERIFADRGVYLAEVETASLLGDVRITRGRNQLNGCRAEVDMNAGTSQLFGCGPGDPAGRQVQGLIHPERGPERGREN